MRFRVESVQAKTSIEHMVVRLYSCMDLGLSHDNGKGVLLGTLVMRIRHYNGFMLAMQMLDDSGSATVEFIEGVSGGSADEVEMEGML